MDFEENQEKERGLAARLWIMWMQHTFRRVPSPSKPFGLLGATREWMIHMHMVQYNAMFRYV